MSPELPLTIVVPVFNEGCNLRSWWEAYRAHLVAGTSVRLVYDFDEDDTLPVARKLVDEGAPISLIRNAGSGVLGAIVTGIRSVVRGPVLVTMADLSDDPAVIPAMLELYRSGADVVVGSRFMTGGRLIGGPWIKVQLARWGGRSLRWLAGFPVADATNSFRLYDASWANSVVIESTQGFVVGFELTAKAWAAGRRVVEVPCTWRDRSQGKSRFKLLRWLPTYARLWARGMAFGIRRRWIGEREQPAPARVGPSPG